MSTPLFRSASLIFQHPSLGFLIGKRYLSKYEKNLLYPIGCVVEEKSSKKEIHWLLAECFVNLLELHENSALYQFVQSQFPQEGMYKKKHIGFFFSEILRNPEIYQVKIYDMVLKNQRIHRYYVMDLSLYHPVLMKIVEKIPTQYMLLPKKVRRDKCMTHVAFLNPTADAINTPEYLATGIYSDFTSNFLKMYFCGIYQSTHTYLANLKLIEEAQVQPVQVYSTLPQQTLYTALPQQTLYTTFYPNTPQIVYTTMPQAQIIYTTTPQPVVYPTSPQEVYPNVVYYKVSPETISTAVESLPEAPVEEEDAPIQEEDAEFVFGGCYYTPPPKQERTTEIEGEYIFVGSSFAETLST